MLLGARFVCVRCQLRGPARRCPRCGNVRLDLASTVDLDELRRRWPLVKAWERGMSFLSPRSIAHNRRLLVLTAVTTVCVAIGAPVMAALGRPDDVSAVEIGMALAVSVVMSPVVFAVFALFFFLYAHVLRWVLLFLMLVASVLPFGALRLVISAFLLRHLAGLVLPRIELDDPGPLTGARDGQLAQSFAFHNVRDGLGWMDRADAWADAFEVESRGERLRIDPRAAFLSFDLSYYRSLASGAAHGEGAYREAPRAPEAPVPVWSDGHGRRARARQRMVASGRPIRWKGGELVDGVVVGTPESPLHIEIG